ncbi:hypothetical protein CH306_23000 [Rhodococcus sp. 15-725-2-2b]|uniref:hypothetical protein n=1 Tax=unclassified Rhodococcus (in: high G+C Gram-positive bacteria) TaxID=192944 RepID=UPI000B9C622E|nr:MULTISPECIES: hypothetical protein [unclassified Rhodococcus (in: high G+C Gram-positive bacteria)]OZC71756.1 hypothetical protein CH277_04435 [Rhodococcus sp. 06-469-3-2]OZD42545.1 hypothetical protein CH264_21850 [Rhodococcus sp. 06-1477-1A]OZE68252.1 hypothetical protein CH306_23000 [Rhodococcus sp. 15-725-2-2b]
MNDLLEDDLIDVWEFKTTQNVEIQAQNALQQRWVTLRQNFYDSYAPGEEVDLKLQRKHIERLENQKRLALIDFPESLELIDDWLDIYLPLPKVVLPSVEDEEDEEDEEEDDVSLSSTKYNVKQSGFGTLFSEVSEKELWEYRYDQPGEDPDPIRILRNMYRGLSQTEIDDNVSIGLVFYAEMLDAIPGGIGPHLRPQQYARHIYHKIIDKYRYDNAEKRKEVIMDFVGDEELFPSDLVISQDIELLEMVSNLKKADMKTIMAAWSWAENAPDDAVMPKSLKQRLKRLNLGQAPEQVTQYNKPVVVSNTPRGLRGEDKNYVYPEQFPVNISQGRKKFKAVVNHPAQVKRSEPVSVVKNDAVEISDRDRRVYIRWFYDNGGDGLTLEDYIEKCFRQAQEMHQ